MLPEPAQRLAVLIPAYRPSAALVDTVRALVDLSFPGILVVDDGSGPSFSDVFTAVAAMPGVTLLRHATNLGKGAALKTGMNHALCTVPDLVGVVTADADGQHHPEDIERVAQSLLAHPQNLVLGCRTFRSDVPLRSRFGNILTSAIMHALMGRKMADTQTGLRGIPAAFAIRILKLEATGYEFELEMLIAAHQFSVGLVEEPIRTIYEPGNQSSHFNPIVDSMKIYFVLLRFGSISFLTALLDNLVFILAWRHWGHVLAAQILGRAVAVCFNYSMVRTSVFYSQQQHKKVLPKYLMLVLASGTASYGGIRLLSATLGANPIGAKLVVETILFFVNFAVQRLFIFRPGDAPALPASQESRDLERDDIDMNVRATRANPMRLLTMLVSLVFLGALAVEAYGFRTSTLFVPDIWEPIGLQRFTRFLGMFLAISFPLLAMVPWAFPIFITGLALAGTAISVGPLPLLAVTLYLISSCALGSRLLGRRHDDSFESQLFATLLGMGVWILLMALTVRLPIHYAATWAVLLALPIALDLSGVRRRLLAFWDALRGIQLGCIWHRAAFAVLVVFLLANWFAALTPETSADGLAMHLAIPTNIAANHRMTFEPARFLWAVMPMGADYTYAIQYLLAGEYASHLIDFTMLLILEALLYTVLRRWLSRGAAFLLLAAFSTTPLVYLATGSLFVENMLAAMVFGWMAALWRFGDTGERRYLYLAAALGGTALATKFGALAFVLLAVPFAAFEVWKHRGKSGAHPAAAGGLAALFLLAMALPTYAIAWFKTGDPLFPFLTNRFPSPLLPPNIDLADLRYLRPLTWNTPFDLTFHTSLTYEGRNGSFGFQYLVFAALAVIAIFFLRRRPAGSAGVVSLGACILVMGSQPNARYLYPALALLTVPFAAVLGWTMQHRWLHRAMLLFLAGVVAVNGYFLPSASYYHRDFCLRLPFSRAERDRFRADVAPIREVIDYYNRAHPNSTVLLTADGVLAGLQGEVYENHWHQFSTQEALRNVKTVPEMVQLMQTWKVQYFIAPKPDGGVVKPAVLREMLERCTEAEYEHGNQYLAHLQPSCKPRPERTPVVVSRGFYDDFDPGLIFRGEWTKSTAFKEPDRETITWSDDPGAEVQIVFEGTALTYTYTAAFNRGLAEVLIDGISQGEIDLYAPKDQTGWQTQKRYCCLAPGKHVAIVRVTGRSNPKSSGHFVDIDSFTVE